MRMPTAVLLRLIDPIYIAFRRIWLTELTLTQCQPNSLKWVEHCPLIAVRLNTPTFVAGIFYFAEDIESDTYVDLKFAGFEISRLSDLKADSSAIYADLRWEFVPQWQLSVGARFSDEEKERVVKAAKVLGCDIAFVSMIKGNVINVRSKINFEEFNQALDADLYAKVAAFYKEKLA